MKTHILLAALALAALSCRLMAGDLKIAFDKEVKSIGTNQKSQEVHYYSSQFQRVTNEKEKTDTLTDYGDFAMYQIDHGKKRISKIALADAVKILEYSASGAQAADPQAQKMMAAMFGGGGGDMTAKTSELGTEKVAGRTCKQWKITVGKSVSILSVDPSLELPMSKRAMEEGAKLASALLAASTAAAPGMGDALAKLQKEAAKIRGVQLRQDTEVSLGFITVRTALAATKVEQGPLPASLFALPKGYQMEDIGKKALEDLKKQSKKK
jgi:hypothetical protein